MGVIGYQRKTAKKAPIRNGIRRSLRLELLCSRPKLDLTFQLPAAKVSHRPIDDNLTSPPEHSTLKPTPANTVDLLSELSEVISFPIINTQSTVEKLTTPDVSLSKANLPTRNLNTPSELFEIVSSSIIDTPSVVEILTTPKVSKHSSSATPTLDLHSPELFMTGSSLQDYLNIGELDENAQSRKWSLRSKSRDPVNSAKTGIAKVKRASQLTSKNIPKPGRKKNNNRRTFNSRRRKLKVNSQKIKKEFQNAAQSFIQGDAQKASSVVMSRKVRRPRKLKRTNTRVGKGSTNPNAVNSKNEHYVNVDELCSEFEMFDFFPKPKYFLKDEKLSLDDCLMSYSSNILTQKLMQLNDFKSRGVVPPPSFTPRICEVEVNCCNHPFGNPSFSGNHDLDDNLEIHNILKNISHVPSKIPSYEPYEESWYEGFDVWST